MLKKKLKVFVDAEVLVMPHFSGIGHYTLELLRSLDKIVENDKTITVELGVNFRQVEKIKSYGFRNFKIRRTPFSLRIANGLKIRDLQPPYDMFFGKRVYLFPNFTSWPTWFSKSVSIVYDLSFEFFPQYADPRNQEFLSSQVKKTAQRSAKIVTISKNSQKEINTFYNKPVKDIPIVYPGVDQTEFFRWPEKEVEKLKTHYKIHGKYILYVGNIEPRKNLKNLLLAYEQLDEKTRKEYSLLLVGARGWLDGEVFDIIKRLRTKGNNILQPDEYVKDSDRAALFSGASLFVYPSEYEGFGIPPIEAMACGVPVITSDNSSLPEAVGDAAKMVSAQSVGQLASAISTVLGDKKLQAEMVKKGYAQVDKFSWDREAEKLLNILQEVNQ